MVWWGGGVKNKLPEWLFFVTFSSCVGNSPHRFFSKSWFLMRLCWLKWFGFFPGNNIWWGLSLNRNTQHISLKLMVIRNFHWRELENRIKGHYFVKNLNVEIFGKHLFFKTKQITVKFRGKWLYFKISCFSFRVLVIEGRHFFSRIRRLNLMWNRLNLKRIFLGDVVADFASHDLGKKKLFS